MTEEVEGPADQGGPKVQIPTIPIRIARSPNQTAGEDSELATILIEISGGLLMQ
jgi:hypothetical protein